MEELASDGFDMVASTVIDEDRERIQESIGSLEKEGDIVSVEYRVRHKNGELVYVVGNVRMVEDNGELVYQRFLLDCTEQKIQERRKEKRQTALVQALCVDYRIVCYFDLDTGKGYAIRSSKQKEWQYRSPEEEELTLEEAMGAYIQEYVHEDDREMLKRASSIEGLKEELEKRNVFCINYRRVWKGETVYFQMKAVRAGIWEESHGIVLGFHSVDEDIRREMEKKNLL